MADLSPANGLHRKTGNSGVFSALPERMSKKHIREIAKEYGISLKGISLVIDFDIDKLRPEFYRAGRADTQTVGRIDFFPKAFASREELTRTIVHEKIHVEQFREFGSEYVQNNRPYFEKLAEEEENVFVARMKKEGRMP